MAAEYEIVAVEDDGAYREWKGGGGSTFHAFKVALKNGAGQVRPNIELNKKPGNAPKVGQTVWGRVEQRGEYGLTFYNEQRPQGQGGSGGGGQQSAGAPGGGEADRGFGWQTNPVDAARMSRAHSQEMAVRVLAASGELAGAAEAVKGMITGWTDWFEADVAGAAAGRRTAEADAAASQPQAADPVDADPGPEYDAPPEDDIPF